MSTRELLLGTALALCLLLPQPSKAVEFALPPDGNFSRSAPLADFSTPDPNPDPKGKPFGDQYIFSIPAGPEVFAIAIARNEFSSPSEEITDFTGAVWSIGPDGFVKTTDDVLKFGPTAAVSCIGGSCLIGSGLIGPGDYYIEISGKASTNAGYSGSFTTVSVPGPVAGAGLPGLVMALGGILGWRRLRKVA